MSFKDMGQRLTALNERASRFIEQLNSLKESMGLSVNGNIGKNTTIVSDKPSASLTNDVTLDSILDELPTLETPKTQYVESVSHVTPKSTESTSDNVANVVNSIDIDDIVNSMGIDLSL